MKKLINKGKPIFHIYSDKSKYLNTPVFEEFRFPLNPVNYNNLIRASNSLRYPKNLHPNILPVGISSPQIGSRKRFIIMENFFYDQQKKIFDINLMKSPEIFLNPEIIDVSQEMIDGWEYCTSIPYLMVYVKRHEKIVIKYQNIDGLR